MHPLILSDIINYMINIRTANKNDLRILQDLNQELFIDNQQYDLDLRMDWPKSEDGKNYFNKILNDPKSCCFIAEENGKSVGYISASPRKINYLKSKWLEIDNMGVSFEYRSRGIGSLLINKCLECAKTKGYSKLYVNAYFANKGAINFYKKNGFSEIDISLQRNI